MVFRCTSCGDRISVNAKSCPKCSEPVDPKIAKETALITCPYCKGEGEIYHRCERCSGTGFIACSSCRGVKHINGRKCDICDGSGKVHCLLCDSGRILEYCEECGFSGYVPKTPQVPPPALGNSDSQRESSQEVVDTGVDLITRLAAEASKWDDEFVEKISSIPGVSVTTTTTVSSDREPYKGSKRGASKPTQKSGLYKFKRYIYRMISKFSKLFK